ncbi:MAG: polysaccharide deacetylase family protein [Lachnospiraceae bacterium]
MAVKETKDRDKRRKEIKRKHDQQIRVIRYAFVAGILVLCAGVGVMVGSLGRSTRKMQSVQAAAEVGAELSEVTVAALGAELETAEFVKIRDDLPDLGAIYGIHVYDVDWSRYFADNSYCMAPAGNYITAVRATINNQPADLTGTIEYTVNLSGSGWLDWTENGQTAGQEDTKAPLEAVCMRLTGELESYYDILYSVLQDNTWSDWVQNGTEAGVAGAGKRVDGIRVSIVKKVAGQSSYAGGIDPNKPMIALTYDDGPTRAVTPRILDLLKANNAKATFFMVGSRVEKDMDLVKQMTDQGCEVANHTYDHIMMNKIDPAQLKWQLEKTNQVVSDACGIAPILMRPCGGARTAAGMEQVGAMSMPAILWSVDTLDWKTRDAESTIRIIRENVKDGDIILMHDLYSTTADASNVIIPELVAQGYQLVTVTELASYRGGMLPGATYSEFWPD